jgi:hypothetical protein
MGYGGERRSPEVRILSVRPLDRRREQRMRWLRRVGAVAVVAAVVVGVAGPGREAVSDFFDEDTDEQPVRAADTQPDGDPASGAG